MRFVRVADVPAPRVRRRDEVSLDAGLDAGHESTQPAAEPRARRCPDCAIELERIRVDGRRVEYCPMCQGMWLERDAASAMVVKRAFARWNPAFDADDPHRSEAPSRYPLRLVSGGRAG